MSIVVHPKGYWKMRSRRGISGRLGERAGKEDPFRIDYLRLCINRLELAKLDRAFRSGSTGRELKCQ